MRNRLENYHQLETDIITKSVVEGKKNEERYLQFDKRRLKIIRQNMADMLSDIIRQCSQSFCSSNIMAKE